VAVSPGLTGQVHFASPILNDYDLPYGVVKGENFVGQTHP
jgi:hypothetical protein